MGKRIKLNNMDLNLLSKEPKPKKIFISYSRQDVTYKDELREHLSLLSHYNAISEWACEDIEAGEWDKQIQSELQKADILIYMVSASFIASSYIMDMEVARGIEIIKNDPNNRIMCVLVKECAWRHWSSLEKEHNKFKKAPDKDITNFQFLPYHKKDREFILSLEQWGRGEYEPRNVAYSQIIDQIKKII
jgi:internalin A